MMERRRYLGQKKSIKDCSTKIVRVDEDGLNGYASLIKIKEVHNPVIVGEDFCICDVGYSIIEFLPDGEHWALEAMYDRNDKIVEWYFDITSENSIDENGNPYNVDLYLDVVLLPDGQIIVCDENELQDALDNGEITQAEFDLAYHTLHELKEKKTLEVVYMKALSSKLRMLLEK